MLIEIKTSIFPSVITTKNKLQECFNIAFALSGFDIILEEITDESSFWAFVESAHGIYEVALKLNSPNLFGGKIDTNEMLKEVNEQYNNTNITIKLFSEKARLWLKKTNEALINALKYISGGAGEWSLTILIEGDKKTYKSKHNIKKVSISNISLIADGVLEDNLNEIIEAINSVETVLLEDKNDEKES